MPQDSSSTDSERLQLVQLLREIQSGSSALSIAARRIGPVMKLLMLGALTTPRDLFANRIRLRENPDCSHPYSQVEVARNRDFPLWARRRLVWASLLLIHCAYVAVWFPITCLAIFLNFQTTHQSTFRLNSDILREHLNSLTSAKIFTATPEYGLFIYAALFGVQLATVALPALFRSCYAYCTHVRFLVEPLAELERVETIAAGHIAVASASLQGQCARQWHVLDESRSISSPSFVREQLRWSQLELVRLTERLLLGSLDNLHLFRPDCYTRRVYIRMAPLNLFLVIYYINTNVVINLMLLWMIYTSVELSSTSATGAQLVVSSSFLMAILECELCFVMFTMSLTGTVAALISQVIHQHLLCSWIQKNLLECERYLRCQLSSQTELNSRELRRILYETLVRYWVFVEDSRNTQRLLSRTSLSTIVFGAVVGLGVGASKLVSVSGENGRHDLATVSSLLIWLFQNGLLLLAATVPARVARAERPAWSLVANVFALHAEKRNQPQLTREPIVNLWLKLVTSDQFGHDHLASRLLASRIDYAFMLKLTYIQISFVLILRSRYAYS